MKKNQHGKTSLEQAVLYGRTEIAEILRLHEINLSEKTQDNYSTTSNEASEMLILGASESENCE